VISLGGLAEEYLATRRTLGYQLTKYDQILATFVRYLDDVGATRNTIEVALGLATQPADAHPIWWKHRLSVARSFVCYLRAFDSTTEVPPTNFLTGTILRAEPYLYSYSSGETADLLSAAHRLRPALRGVTYKTAIGLLLVAGACA
jgi:hypothetical protein